MPITLEVSETLVPFCFLRVRKGRDYSLFNPVDNKEHVLNYIEYSILNQCNGTHTLNEIATALAEDFVMSKIEAITFVIGFLDKMYKSGIIALRNRKMNFNKNWPSPATVFWDITSECNLCCSHCYNPNERAGRSELSTKEIIRILEEMSIFGVESIIFGGGEPILRRDFFEIAGYAGSLEFKSLSIATNGTLIDREIAKRLKVVNLKVQVSIDGDVAEIHDTIRGVNGAFDKAIRGIKLLQEEGNTVSVCSTATKLNVDRLPNLIQFMQKLGIDNYRVQGFIPIGRGKINMEELRLSPKRMRDVVADLESKNIIVSGYGFTLKPPPTDPVNLYGSGSCSAANSSCSITPEGNVIPCVHFWGMNGENLRDHSFRWIWKNSTLLNYFRSILLDDIKEGCRECKWINLCHGGCKAENYANGDIFGANPSCWVADEMR